MEVPVRGLPPVLPLGVTCRSSSQRGWARTPVPPGHPGGFPALGQASLLLGDVPLAVTFKKVPPTQTEGKERGWFLSAEPENRFPEHLAPKPRDSGEIGYLRRGQAARLLPTGRAAWRLGGGAQAEPAPPSDPLPPAWCRLSFKNWNLVLPAGHSGAQTLGSKAVKGPSQDPEIQPPVLQTAHAPATSGPRPAPGQEGLSATRKKRRYFLKHVFCGA